MTKTEFVLELTSKLSLLPWEEVEDRISFYVEMIDDRMEDGLSEEEAVAAVGSVDEIAAQIIDGGVRNQRNAAQKCTGRTDIGAEPGFSLSERIQYHHRQQDAEQNQQQIFEPFEKTIAGKEFAAAPFFRNR